MVASAPTSGPERDRIFSFSALYRRGAAITRGCAEAQREAAGYDRESGKAKVVILSPLVLLSELVWVDVIRRSSADSSQGLE